MKEWDGTFELIDPRTINFDRTKYQRDEDWPLIGTIASQPRWSSFVVVPCAKREYAGGTLWAYDGQQRLLGVLSSAEPPKLVPVMWWAVKSRAEEASIFLDVNVNRRAVTALGKFKAQVGAENATYLTIARALEECGYSLSFGGDTAKSVAAVGGLQNIYNASGEAGLRVALASVDEAWPDEKSATSERMLSLFAEVLGEMSSNGGIDQDKFVAALRRTTPGQLTRRAKDIKYETDCSLKVAVRRAFKTLGKL